MYKYLFTQLCFYSPRLSLKLFYPLFKSLSYHKVHRVKHLLYMKQFFCSHFHILAFQCSFLFLALY